ncbi:hypothetical protein CEUSTIGMA_g8594.t1 [Chlamydomonas eustigma]|uniref:Protease Do-like PDZ domain-containing protein n=1 Tax=Chlamydomonas eustigma TaxID=1157962 RepID=A0A250XDP2_9CHLO|nr:hypothetical protein CEUSTIGMA_g8594.t1 [Chlamydomonas eustigma]|eukprot:GAX81161.1 hypothetical protein CEUSTIGMA_g8594.t1 [Chlamydomonas eustigma]
MYSQGLVFVPLSQPYLHEYGDDWVNSSPRRLYDKAMHLLMQRPQQQIVVLTQVLSDDVNSGYQQFQNLQVLRVNGVDVLNLAHLGQLIWGSKPSGHAAPNESQQHLSSLSTTLNDASQSTSSAPNNGDASHMASKVSGTQGYRRGDDFLRFELEDERIMVVDRKLAEAAASAISARYRIPSMMSSDILGDVPTVPLSDEQSMA